MSTQKNDGWIKFSEQRPCQSDLPIWAYHPGSDPVLHKNSIPITGPTHWQHAYQRWEPHSPPPKELTEAEKDKQAFRTWSNAELSQWVLTREDAWHAACAYKSKQIREELKIILERGDWDELRKLAEGGAK